MRQTIRRGNYGADGQITKDVSGAVRTSDQLAGGSGYPKYPNPGEHALSAPTPSHTSGRSPSQHGSSGENVGAGPDRRNLPRGALAVTTGGRPRGGGSALSRAKVLLADHRVGSGASPGNRGIEGKAGNRTFGEGEHGSAESTSVTGSPISQTDLPGAPVSPSDLHGGGGKKGVVFGGGKTGAGNRSGPSFPFGGRVEGGRGRDRGA